MAHPTAELLNILEGKKGHICDKNCKYYESNFSHLKCACVLSEVFSVDQGKNCFEYVNRKEGAHE